MTVYSIKFNNYLKKLQQMLRKQIIKFSHQITSDVVNEIIILKEKNCLKRNIGIIETLNQFSVTKIVQVLKKKIH